MSLTKKVYLTISGYDIKLSDNLTFYQKDQLKLIFYINEYGIDYENKAEKTVKTVASDSEKLPEEKIQEAYKEHVASVENALVDQIMINDPSFFEHLVVELLLKMGYGYDEKSGIVVGKSHDGGIDGIINEDILTNSLDRLKVDKTGLDETDRLLLTAIIERFNGGPVGLDALASSIGEESSTIEDVYEPYLLQTGLLKRTARGRMVTDLAYRHLHIEKKN